MVQKKLVVASKDETLFSQGEKLLSAFLDRSRQATLGFLVKGIVHNLNGSLQILSMQMELLREALLKEEDKVSPSLNVKTGQCLAEMDKLKALVEVLMHKAIHEDQETPQRIYLNNLLEEELSLLHHNLFFKHQVEVVKSFYPQLPPLRGCYRDISQGLSPLIQNALEAMGTTPNKKLVVSTSLREKQVQLSIQDTGCGISPEIEPDLFKPFCTNKRGKHFGLGLFISREVLTPYGASFSYASRPGETTFSVFFPLENTGTD